MAVRDELAELMRQATLKKSQRAIAKEADVSQTTIGNMVLGRVPGKEICQRVAKAADIDMHEILIAAGYEESGDPLDRCINGLRASRLSEKTLSDIRGYIANKIAEEESCK